MPMPDAATPSVIKLQMVGSAPRADFEIVLGFAMFHWRGSPSQDNNRICYLMRKWFRTASRNRKMSGAESSAWNIPAKATLSGMRG